jgi:hypothetical protein
MKLEITSYVIQTSWSTIQTKRTKAAHDARKGKQMKNTTKTEQKKRRPINVRIARPNFILFCDPRCFFHGLL